MGEITQKWVNLLFSFTDGYINQYTESELARKSNIPQQTASRYLRELVDGGYINYTSQGRNKLYFIDASKKSAEIIYTIIECYKALEFQKKYNEVSVIVNELISQADAMIIFGSYASGTIHQESDIDVVFLGSCNIKKIKEIKRRQAVAINEHYLSFKEFSKALQSKNPLSIEIINNHILFGNISKIIHTFIEVKK